MKDQNDESLNALEAVVEEESRNVQQEVSDLDRGSICHDMCLAVTDKEDEGFELGRQHWLFHQERNLAMVKKYRERMIWSNVLI